MKLDSTVTERPGIPTEEGRLFCCRARTSLFNKDRTLPPSGRPSCHKVRTEESNFNISSTARMYLYTTFEVNLHGLISITELILQSASPHLPCNSVQGFNCIKLCRTYFNTMGLCHIGITSWHHAWTNTFHSGGLGRVWPPSLPRLIPLRFPFIGTIKATIYVHLS